ncbi:MAG: tetratricopeptide repeat protein [Proteobacteria bacterium]|nr:tetratricopeptide repeat protein [Pseudomonadota bacterium]
MKRYFDGRFRALAIAVVAFAVVFVLPVEVVDFSLEISTVEAKRRARSGKNSRRARRVAQRIQRHLYTAEYYLLQENNARAAAKEYRRVLALDRLHVLATLALADIHVRRKKASKAIRLLKKLAKKRPRQPRVWHALGRAFAARGKHRDAMRAYRRAIQYNPNDSTARWLIVANLHKRYRRGNRALKGKLRRAVNSFLDHAPLPRGPEYQLAERIRIELSGDPIELVIHDARVAYEAAFTETRIGKINQHMETARQGFAECLRSRPTDQRCHYGMGLIHSSVKASEHYDRQSARKHFARADQIPEAHIALARMLRLAGDLDSAELALRRALMLDPHHQRARLELAIIYKLDGRDRAAIKSFAKSIAIDRFSADARRALDELSVLDPEHPLVQQALMLGTVAGDILSSQRFQAAVRMIEEHLGGVENDAPEQAALDAILSRILDAADVGAKASLRVRVLKIDVPNAIALPNGNIYFTRGLLDFIKGHWPDRALDAGNAILGHVMAHEVSHILRRHAMQNVLYREAAKDSFRSLDYMVLTQVGRLQEIEADRVGMVLAFLAGYDPRGGIELMEARGQTEEIPKHLDHPTFEERIHYLEEYWSNQFKYAFVSFELGVNELEQGNVLFGLRDASAPAHYRKAIAHFRRFRDTVKPSKAVLNNMGIAYARLGMYALASAGTPLHRWQTDLSIEREAAVKYVALLGEEQRTRGVKSRTMPRALRQAISLFREALGRDPNYARARLNLAAAYLAAGDHVMAQRTLARATGSGSIGAHMALLRGIIYAEEGQYARSGAAFRSAKKHRSTHKQATYNMARLYQVARFTDKARTAYRDYLERYPDGPWAGAARKALDSL